MALNGFINEQILDTMWLPEPRVIVLVLLVVYKNGAFVANTIQGSQVRLHKHRRIQAHLLLGAADGAELARLKLQKCCGWVDFLYGLRQGCIALQGRGRRLFCRALLGGRLLLRRLLDRLLGSTLLWHCARCNLTWWVFKLVSELV
jgi:hypothetical protein